MNGIILIDKEKEYTSHDVVAIVKKITKSKVGHTGTLDPNATGVLPLLVGDATKVSKYLINHDKEYIVELQLGKKTTTADIEGDIIEEKEVQNWIFEDKERLERILQSFVGKQKQIPPMYSAIKVNGKKLYDYARQGKEIKIEPRNIEIYKIELLSVDRNQETINFKVKCSKGTYIRSLCEDIATKLETAGYMKNLRRIQVGSFKIEDSVTITKLKKDMESGNKLNLIPVEKILMDIPTIELKEEKLKLYLNGVKIKTDKENGVYKVLVNNKFIGTGIIKDNTLKRDIVLDV